MTTDVINLLNHLDILDDNEIKTLLERLSNEKNKRERAKREQLVTAFKVAFADLMDAGISVEYSNDWEDPTYITDFDDFSFGF